MVQTTTFPLELGLQRIPLKLVTVWWRSGPKLSLARAIYSIRRIWSQLRSSRDWSSVVAPDRLLRLDLYFPRKLEQISKGLSSNFNCPWSQLFASLPSTIGHLPPLYYLRTLYMYTLSRVVVSLLRSNVAWNPFCRAISCYSRVINSAFWSAWALP